MNGRRCYTIYDRPDDFPDHVVVRVFKLFGGKPQAELGVWICDTVEQARHTIPPGLVCFPRDATDPPNIVETWL